MGHYMLLCVLLVGVGVGLITAADEYNFNSLSYCKKGGYSKTLSSGDRATVLFRPKTGLFDVPDTCYMTFKAPLIGKNRLQVKFDAINRYINDSKATITFYDDDEIKFDKVLKTYSKSRPIKPRDTIMTTGRSLTISVARALRTSKNYYVEMTVVPINSGALSVWSLPLMLLSTLVVVLSRL